MPYERTREIEQRFQMTITLLQKKRLNAGQLALELGVSRPTAQRVISELRNRGYRIRSIRDESGWAYEFVAKKLSKTSGLMNNRKSLSQQG
jgi:biotin operon repressor